MEEALTEFRMAISQSNLDHMIETTRDDSLTGGAWGCDPVLLYVSYALTVGALLVQSRGLAPESTFGPLAAELFDVDYVIVLQTRIGRYSAEQWRSWFVTLMYLAWSLLPGTSAVTDESGVERSTMEVITSVTPQLLLVMRSMSVTARLYFIARLLCLVLTLIKGLAQIGASAVRITMNLAALIARAAQMIRDKLKRD